MKLTCMRRMKWSGSLLRLVSALIFQPGASFKLKTPARLVENDLVSWCYSQYSFISCLAVNNRLCTQGRLAKWGYNGTSYVYSEEGKWNSKTICSLDVHLLEGIGSRSLRFAWLIQICLIGMKLCSGGVHELKGKRFHLWLQCNARIHNYDVKAEEGILEAIRDDVRRRIGVRKRV